MTLSNFIVIPIVNGLFDAHHPLDSEVMYGATVTVDGNLNEKISDSILIIKRKYTRSRGAAEGAKVNTRCAHIDMYRYHIEAQRTAEDMVYRTYDYSYRYAMTEGRETAEAGGKILKFPESRVVCLYPSKQKPRRRVLCLDYGKQGTFVYRVERVALLDYTAAEMCEKGLTGFLPFLLLKMEKEMREKREASIIRRLNILVNDDILGNIEEMHEKEQITLEDYISLQEFTGMLFVHLYGKYREVKEMTETMEGVMKLKWEIMRDEGLAQGREQGLSQGRQEIIAKMRQSGMSEDEIRRIVGEEMI